MTYDNHQISRRYLSVRLLAALAFVLLSLPAQSASLVLKVVATTPDLGVVARSVGGDRVSVEVLALHTQDPHWVDAKPRLALSLAEADLLLVTGADLEIGWLPKLQTAARNADIQTGGKGYLDCSTLVTLIDLPTVKVDRSMGDVHPQGNPHYMLDPQAVERVAVGIGKRMAKLDPAGKDIYLKNTKALVGELRRARPRWEKKLAKAKGKNVVAYHKSLGYLARWIGFKVVEYVEPRPGIPPNPRHVAHVIKTARAEHARALLQETWFPKNTSSSIAKQAGLELMPLSTMPNFEGGQSYVAFLDAIALRVAKAVQ